MKIALLAHNLRGGGASTLGKNVVANMARVGSRHQFVVTALKGFGYGEFLRDLPNVELREYDLHGWRGRYQTEKEVAKYLDDWGCDWAWWLGNMGIVFPKCRQSVYIRTPFAVNYPKENWGDASLKFRLKAKLDNVFIRRTLKRCKHTLAQTEAMRNRLLSTYSFLKPENVGLCPAPPLFKTGGIDPSDQTLALMKELSVKDAGKFRALYVSILNPHKNMSRIIDMFDQYRSELKDVVLYVTARTDNGGYSGELWKKVERLGLTDTIRFLGVFPQKDVPALYDACDVVFFPSLLETVGHAHNDAMFFERPLIASDIDFGHELCGDAAYFVDPLSTESMKNGLLRLKNDPALRKELVEKGKNRQTNVVPSWDEIVGNVLKFEGVDF